MTARLLAAAAAVCTTASLLAIAPTAHAASATVVGEASCLYGGPSWMSSWSVTSEYAFSVYGAGLERTHQFDETEATLEVLVNVGSSDAPNYEVIATTITRPAGCDGTTPPPQPVIEVEPIQVEPVPVESVEPEPVADSVEIADSVPSAGDDDDGDDDRERNDRKDHSLHHRRDHDRDRRDRHETSDRNDRRDDRDVRTVRIAPVR